jgi:hypothetical protein
MHMPNTPQRGSWFQSRITTWALLGFLAVGGFFLFTEHTAHLLGFLPYALLLLCPLMMLFMHRSHGGHGSMGMDQHSGEQPKEGEPK